MTTVCLLLTTSPAATPAEFVLTTESLSALFGGRRLGGGLLHTEAFNNPADQLGASLTPSATAGGTRTSPPTGSSSGRGPRDRRVRSLGR